MSSRYVYDDKERLVAWAESRLDRIRFRSDAVAIGHERRGELAGVVVFDTFSPTSCCIGVASDGSGTWVTRGFLIRVFAFPFQQCGFNRISALVSERNAASLAFTRNAKFGWRQEGLLREAGPDGEDMLLFGMLRRECNPRFLPGLLSAPVPLAK